MDSINPSVDDARPDSHDVILVVAPPSAETEALIATLTDAGLRCEACCQLLDRLPVVTEYGVVLLHAADLSVACADRLASVLDSQPTWSSLPVLLSMRTSYWPRLANCRGVSVLNDHLSLVEQLHSALAARQRQFQTRSELVVAQTLAREMQHRQKNMLMIVGLLAGRTFLPTRPPAEALHIFLTRLEAMAVAQTILTASHGSFLQPIITEALGAFLADDAFRIGMDGPEVWISERQVMALTMAFHELATNAIKYGALSVPSGRVTITWRVEGDRLSLRWQESDGPIVLSPVGRHGFGSRLIERILAQELHGTATLDWQPQGVVCDIIVPL